MSNMPYSSQKMNTRELTTQLLEAHGGAFNPLLHPDGYLEGVLTFGPPGIGKTQSVMAAAKEIAADANAELVVYRPGVVRDPNKNQVLFVHMSMAGMTSGGVLGFPTVSSNDRVDANDSASTKLEKQRRFVSQQVIPEIWRSAMEFEQAIYLFDEITHVISQEAMLSLLSEGFYGETELAKRTLFIATANEGVADGTLQQKLSTAFRNRFTAYYIGANVKQWREVENFKIPENNLLNFPSLRGLTMLGQDMEYFEARNFRERTAEGVVNPRGEYKENVTVTPEQEKVLTRLAFGRLGHEGYATDFVNMYTVAWRSVIPEIRKAINGKFNEIPDDFKKILSQDSDEAVARQKENLKGKNSDERLRQSQQDIAKAFTYVDYVPRMFLDALKSFPSNANIYADAKKRMAEQKKPWPADDKVPAEMLRGYGNALIDNFLKSVMLLPPNMQMMCIHHFCELAGTEETKQAMRPFETPGQPAGASDVVRGMLLHHLAFKMNNPDYKRLNDAFMENNLAKSVMEGLGV